jgi:mRNA-degrading endonuclease RelE of RelBE toxin-antitoxin system
VGRYKIIVSSRADKFLDDLNKKLRHKLIEEISDLENFPFFTKPHDIAKLKGRKGYYRLRTGKIRTIFKVNKNQRTIYIEKIGYRKRIYE